MKKYFLVLLTAGSVALAQQSPVANPAGMAPPQARPSLATPQRHHQEPGAVVRPKANFRIRLEIQEGKEAPMEISVVTADGRVKTQMVSPKKTVIDDREVPSTLDFTGTLTALDSDQCQFNLFLGRTIPYVTGSHKGPDGRSVSQYQQMQVGLETTVILQVGKALVVQSDPLQQVKVTLERVP